MSRGNFVSSLFLVGALSTAACVEEGVDVDASSLTPDDPVYLAAGDSYTFGSDPHFYPADTIIGGIGLAPENDQPFVSFADNISEWTDRKHVNSACHGESSASYLSTTPEAGNQCQTWRFVEDYDLHVQYSGSQNEFVYNFLSENPQIELVTFVVGANDVFMLQRRCAGSLACMQAELPGVFQRAAQNFAVALGTIRSVYSGPLIIPNYYSPNYNDPVITFAAFQWGQIMAQIAPQFGAQVVDVFSAFAAASAPFGGNVCAAGLIIPRGDGTCDHHSSPAGDELIANTIISAAGL